MLGTIAIGFALVLLWISGVVTGVFLAHTLSPIRRARIDDATAEAGGAR